MFNNVDDNCDWLANCSCKKYNLLSLAPRIKIKMIVKIKLTSHAYGKFCSKVSLIFPIVVCFVMHCGDRYFSFKLGELGGDKMSKKICFSRTPFSNWLK